MLDGIKPFFENIVFVSNGVINVQSKKRLKAIVSDIIERENKGFDAWAYKEALEYVSFEELLKYDELVMMNHTIMGPVFPFSEVFAEMEGRNIDFWGLTAYHTLSEISVKKCRYGYLPFHIQSHFIAVRKSLYSSYVFKQYWDNLPKISSYQDSVFLHEAVFTKYFFDHGYKYAVYADPSGLTEHNLCPIIYSPAKLLEETRCPVFKRRTFYHDMDDLQAFSMCNQACELMGFLCEKTDFDISLIWENILRTCSLIDIQRCMGLFVFPQENRDIEKETKIKTALVLHLYYNDQIEFYSHYAKFMPKGSDLYITTSNETQYEYIRKHFFDEVWGNVKVILVENRGRDISSLLVGVREEVKKYDLVCFAHDKKSHEGENLIVGEEFVRHCFDNILGSAAYVLSIIKEFQDFPQLGLLSPPPPYHSTYTQTIGDEWTCNFKQTLQLAEALDIDVPISGDRLPAAPLGTIFWFRPAALMPLLKRKWKYEDFPEEPNNNDGTMLHAIERLYPFAAQAAGYYSAWCLRGHNAERYFTTVYSMLQNEVYARKYGNVRYYMLYRIKEAIKRKVSPKNWRNLKMFIKKIFP